MRVISTFAKCLIALGAFTGTGLDAVALAAEPSRHTDAPPLGEPSAESPVSAEQTTAVDPPHEARTPWSRKIVGMGQIANIVLVTAAAAAAVAESDSSGYVSATPTTLAGAVVGATLIDATSFVYSLVAFDEFSSRRQLIAVFAIGDHNYTLLGGPGVETWRTPGFAGLGFEYRMGIDDTWGAFFGYSRGVMQENQLNQSFAIRDYFQQEGGLYLEYPLRLGRDAELRRRIQFGAGLSYQHYVCDDQPGADGCSGTPIARIPNEDQGQRIREHLGYRFGVGTGADFVLFRHWVVGASVQVHVGPHTNLTGRWPIVGSSGRAEARLGTGVLF